MQPTRPIKIANWRHKLRKFKTTSKEKKKNRIKSFKDIKEAAKRDKQNKQLKLPES